MGQALYGATQIHITDLTTESNPIQITEEDIIADPTTPTARSTILISSAGHRATRHNITGFCSVAEYAALNVLYLAKSTNTLWIYVDGVQLLSKSSKIDKLSMSIKAGERGKINITISFIEI